MSEATQDLIGKLLDATAQRDAIHIAVAPMVAAVPLRPGQRVGTDGNGRISASEPHIGVVDPFLASPVLVGQRCFIFLYPNTATGLRHVYTHPVLDSKEAVDRAASEKWLREFAEENFKDYDDDTSDVYAQFLKDAEEGDFCFRSQPDWLYEEGAQTKQEMWAHLEVVRGRPFTFGHKSGAAYRCSC